MDENKQFTTIYGEPITGEIVNVHENTVIVRTADEISKGMEKRRMKKYEVGSS